jgi:hypothetical protein
MEIAAAVNDILATGILTLGPYTRQFEDAFAAAHGGAASRLEAVATSSGTAALAARTRARRGGRGFRTAGGRRPCHVLDARAVQAAGDQPDTPGRCTAGLAREGAGVDRFVIVPRRHRHPLCSERGLIDR